MTALRIREESALQDQFPFPVIQVRDDLEGVSLGEVLGREGLTVPERFGDIPDREPVTLFYPGVIIPVPEEEGENAEVYEIGPVYPREGPGDHRLEAEI